MSLLLRVIKAAHCRSTHHFIVVDALPELRCQHADAWSKVFLEHYNAFLTGAKAPDKEFKDFRNHVLHVSQNNWGGAIKATRKWYDKSLQLFKRGHFEEAVYAAGVMTHYYTDPIQPFHTGQSQAESNIHRAAEWSITTSYAELCEVKAASRGLPTVTAGEGETWLEEMVEAGAVYSHQFYQTLIDEYDFKKGKSDPPTGLNGVSRGILAKLIHFATMGTARILDRLVTEAGVAPQPTTLTLATFMATLEMPIRYVTKKIASGEERRTVQAMYEEYHRTGAVTKTLSLEQRVMKKLVLQELGEAGKMPESGGTSLRTTSTKTSRGELETSSSERQAKRKRSTRTTSDRATEHVAISSRRNPLIEEPVSASLSSDVLDFDTAATANTTEKRSTEETLKRLRKQYGGKRRSPEPAEAAESDAPRRVKKRDTTGSSVASEPAPSLREPERESPTTLKLEQPVREAPASRDTRPVYLASNQRTSDEPTSQRRTTEERSTSASAYTEQRREPERSDHSERSQTAAASRVSETQQQRPAPTPESSHQPSHQPSHHSAPTESTRKLSKKERRRLAKQRAKESRSLGLAAGTVATTENEQGETESAATSSNYRAQSVTPRETDQRGNRQSEQNERNQAKAQKPLRFYLNNADEVEAAPSIGPKTGSRLRKVGISTVADLLAADAAATATAIDVKHIREATITDWQDQATLVCRIPQIRGHDAQILVACDFRTAEAVASASVRQLHQKAVEFAESSEGVRVLRGSNAPDLEEVQNWIAWATERRSLRAA